ncbi:MAG: hypothetical protein PVI31_14215, partial [Gemmatimonadota bacterium]
MKRIMTWSGLTVLALVVLAAPASAQANVAGTWNITIQGPEGPAEAQAELVQDGATFTGTISVDQAEGASIGDGAIEGNTISFVLTVSVQGQSFPLEVTGEVDGDSI